MKLYKLMLLSITLTSSTAFAADSINLIAPDRAYFLAQNDTRNPNDRRLGPIEQRRDAEKSKKTDSSDSSSSEQGVTKAAIAVCSGEFAFCASSTCVRTGKQITVKENGGKTTKQYPEVLCTCPIITKKIAVEQNGQPLVGIAALNEGNMGGSCAPPAAGKVWSYFSNAITTYPQESAGFESKPAVSQSCPASDGGGSNCWSFLCSIDPKVVKTSTGDVRTATCSCPLNDGLFGSKALKTSSYTTFAGTYSSQPSSSCKQAPVGFPNQLLQ